MFLQGRTDYSTPILIDQDVDYYGFLTSDEFKASQDYLIGYLSMDVYVSPYFGQGSGAYRELDKVYEAFKSKVLSSDARPMGLTAEQYYAKRETSGISPALILAAAAAFFFAG